MLEYLFNKETLTQMIPCKICEICRNIFLNRTPPLAASKKGVETVLLLLVIQCCLALMKGEFEKEIEGPKLNT